MLRILDLLSKNIKHSFSLMKFEFTLLLRQKLGKFQILRRGRIFCVVKNNTFLEQALKLFYLTMNLEVAAYFLACQQ